MATPAEARGEYRVRHGQIFESSPDAIVVVGRDGDVVDLNPAAEAMFGWTRAEICGQPVEVLVPRDVRVRHVQLRDAYFAAPRPRPMAERDSLHAVRRGGSEFPVEIQLAPVLPSGSGLVLATVRDVSERRRLAAMVAQGQRFDAIGRLAGGVAHDFGNILTVILANSDLLRESLPPGSREHFACEAIGEAARTGAAIAQQLLAVGRRQVLEPAPVDLCDVVRAMSRFLQGLVGGGVVVKTELPATSRPVLADRAQVEQILINLTTNARDAMPSGGCIGIGVSDLPLAEGAAGAVELRVTDSGSGIAPDLLDRIFEPFFSTKSCGSGLGLATVHGIVAQMDGRISVESRVGKGTTFRVLLPATQLDVAATALPNGARASESTDAWIVVVDDDGHVRTVMAEALRTAGHRVQAVGSAREALSVMGTGEGPDLLITDVRMPEAGGLVLMDAARARFPHLRVLFVSALIGEAALRAGGVHTEPFLAKPFSTAAFLAKVAEALGRRSES